MKERDFYKTFNVGPVLGQGAFGTVHYCEVKKGKVPCAVKIIEKASIIDHPNKSKLCTLLHGEIRTLKKLKKG